MPYDYPAKSLDIQERLMMLGLRPNHLMMIGAFITAYLWELEARIAELKEQIRSEENTHVIA